MLGIIIQLLVSWGILWIVEKQNLSVLGFKPTKQRIGTFFIFFLLTAILCCSGPFLQWLIAKQGWIKNPNQSVNSIGEGIFWNIKSVLFEELIFRGALLYILIKRIGSAWAIAFSSISFGIYHWFSHEVLGNPQQMAITFVITGAMGLILAFAYFRTFSLYIPIAIHLGWNIASSVLFSQSILGGQIFIPGKPAPVVTISYPLYFIMILFPIVSTLLINYFLIKRIDKKISIPAKRKTRNYLSAELSNN